jgi:hypothetical protein
MFIYMPLMKVRREDDTGWYTVDHLNFNYIGLGINKPITLVQSNNQAKNLNKIYVYNGEDYPYDIDNPKEELLYKSTMEEELKAKMPKLLEANTESTVAEQKNINIDPKGYPGAPGTLLLEHRTLTDKDETFHILNYWDDVSKKWIPLNNIWG